MLALVKVGWNENTCTERIEEALADALGTAAFDVIYTEAALEALCAAQQGKQGNIVLFALVLPKGGMSLAYIRLISWLTGHPQCLRGWSGAVIVDGPSELFTKKIGRELIFIANQAGCAFPGKPLVEATGSLYNFSTQARLQGVDKLQAYKNSAAALVQKTAAFAACRQRGLPKEAPPRRLRILVLHASSRKTSNTLLLWELIRQAMGSRVETTEISLRNGAVVDCRGCSYEACLHFGEQEDCFYGGVMVDKVYPAVGWCDAIMLICPNYNDAVSANIMAFFNRLTALFRKDVSAFSQKKIYALVVSGYSGGDLVAEQVLDAMTCNKNFILPPYFALIETANDPQSIMQRPGIRERAAAMAERIVENN
ncbi:flavodoxin [Megasphaera cerevisiae DSM 20462]|jgi:multimeric flavodoxin WrbA|uniref:Flavodoxin n=1 Tax=Megasphaera cerevisiae DSM 20462 TaxID=1122219 RepID=A0A0J6WW66_9FIRM|nr:NAD(P)H-dependent oxidoreductase [Megasphaera cerevisiae]KMO86458.1 flavodoxin [Megasphaera cerevisiae DSM 20462]OKY53389.1 NADPH-dependent oxidoreductase [Megasphaera cerevisiae]SJZ94920.1 Multimeric flavodoxin WrbA [Megasphaera cerevisiae DSM 20462]